MTATMKAFVFLALVLGAEAAAAGISDTGGHCLLSYRASIKKKHYKPHLEMLEQQGEAHKEALLLEEQAQAFSTKLKAWRKTHEVAEQAVKKSRGPFEDFIRANADGSDKCHARLLEAKRVLDGIRGKVEELNIQLKGHLEVVETETENLEIAEASIEATEKQYEAKREKCREEHEVAKADLAKYKAELEELRQMANPDVKYDFNFNNNAITNTETAGNNNNNAGESLLQSDSKPKKSDGHLKKKKAVQFLDRAQCEKFVAFQKRNNKGQAKDDGDKDRDCDKNRDALQEEFAEAWKKIQELIVEAQERIDELPDCLEQVQIEENAVLVPLVSARDVAAERLESATDAIASLSVVIETLKDRLEKLRIHIIELSHECKDCDEVSEHLKKVRDLIKSLEECPGREDFKLKIPAATEANDDDDDEEDDIPDLNKDPFNEIPLTGNFNACFLGVKGTTESTKLGCCPKECGTCGGSGCSKRPGGKYNTWAKENCCTKNIEATCTDQSGPPPCLYEKEV